MLSCYQQLRPQVFPWQQRPQLPFGSSVVSVHLGNSRLVVGLIDILEEFKDIGFFYIGFSNNMVFDPCFYAWSWAIHIT